MNAQLFKPTVSLGVTCAVVYTYGCGDGRISPTRCAVIDAGLDDRYRPRRADRTPPAGVGSARIAPAAASRPGSTIDPGGFRRPKTTPPSTTTPCGDASLARCAPDTRPCRPRLCLVENSLQYTISKTAINLSSAESPPIIGRDALLALVNWIERQRHHDPIWPSSDMAARASGTTAAADCAAEPDGDAAPRDDMASGGAP